MKKILVFTDSLGLSREVPEKCSYENTWPVLLKNYGYIVNQVSIGGATSTDLANQCHYQKSFDPDFVIVQVGIVDCAPRFMTRKEMNFVAINSFLEKVTFKLLARNSVRNFRNVTYTTPKQFKHNLEKIQNSFKGKEVLFIEIMPALDGYENLLPKINSKIIEYNKIIESFNSLKTKDFEKTHIMSDYHHLSEKGHEKLTLQVLSKIKKLNG